MKRTVFLIALLFLLASLVSCRQTTPTETPSGEPPASTEENSISPLPEETKDTQTEKVLGSITHGLFLRGLPDGTSLAYGLGSMFVPPGNQHPYNQYGYYEFPLFVSKTENGSPEQIIATISDPEPQEIGAEWEIVIEDPDYQNFILRVKLIRTEEDYKYNIEFSFSGNGGDSWSGPIPWPLMSKEEHEALQK